MDNWAGWSIDWLLVSSVSGFTLTVVGGLTYLFWIQSLLELENCGPSSKYHFLTDPLLKYAALLCFGIMLMFGFTFSSNVMDQPLYNSDSFLSSYFSFLPGDTDPELLNPWPETNTTLDQVWQAIYFEENIYLFILVSMLILTFVTQMNPQHNIQLFDSFLDQIYTRITHVFFKITKTIHIDIEKGIVNTIIFEGYFQKLLSSNTTLHILKNFPFLLMLTGSAFVVVIFAIFLA